MYLYFNGDSFIAGSELGDDILPEYPGMVDSTSDRKQFKSWYIKTRKLVTGDLQKELDVLERSRAFPAKTANILNLPFVNKALGGSSMDRIARTTIADLLKLKRKNTNNVVAIIGTTGWGRSEFALYRKARPNWQCIVPYVTHLNETELTETLRKYKTLNETDYHHGINFYKNVILIQDFCKLNNIPLLWISVICDPPYTDFRELEKYADYVNYRDYANLNYAIDMNECVNTYFKGQPIVCPGGHYGEPAHDLMAKKLADIIRNLPRD